MADLPSHYFYPHLHIHSADHPVTDARRNSTYACVMAFVTIVLTVSVCVFSGNLAHATTYPTWEDVQNAKANTVQAAAKSNEIQGLITTLKTQMGEAQTLAEQRGNELQVADDALFEATHRATDLSDRAAKSQTEADEASMRAGRLTAQLYRSGGSDLSINLILDEEDSEKLLAKLGSMTKLAERSNNVYVNAATAKNAAKSLGEQAKIAQAEREILREKASTTLKEAAAAAEKVAATLADNETKTAQLEAQLAALRATETTTIDEYRKGVEAREREGGAGPGQPGGGNNQGWTVPAYGPITDHFGERPPICGPDGCSGGFHRGTDIGTGCSAPIYAASSGTVVYAGLNGTYGFFILLDHGNGLQTGYAHIRFGGIFVRLGQSVTVGQNIASTGKTGASTGCHLHFEVRPHGVAVNAVPFMRQQGAALG